MFRPSSTRMLGGASALEQLLVEGRGRRRFPRDLPGLGREASPRRREEKVGQARTPLPGGSPRA
ncbi:MAG: hypothetical protein HS126_38840 [Anaerolineales bacterium]|nr:hypothetical protein [Anaerolineales bacterium]